MHTDRPDRVISIDRGAPSPVSGPSMDAAIAGLPLAGRVEVAPANRVRTPCRHPICSCFHQGGPGPCVEKLEADRVAADLARNVNKGAVAALQHDADALALELGREVPLNEAAMRAAFAFGRGLPPVAEE